MADESNDSSVTPEKNDAQNISISSSGNSSSLSNGVKTRANHRRASIGSHHVGDNSTRNSTEKPDSANSSQNVVPHYLRASTGSCHDFCKYGKKHSSEEKARKPFRRRIAKPLLNEHPVEIFVSGEPKKERVVKHKSPTDTKNHSPDLKLTPDTKSNSPTPRLSSGKTKVIKNKPSTDTKTHSPDLPSTAKKTNFRKPKISSDAKNYSLKQNPSSENTLVLPKDNKSSSTEKFPSPDPPEIVKSVIFPSKVVEDRIKQSPSTNDKTSRADKKTTYLSKQRSSAVKPKPAKAKPLSSSSELAKPVKAKPLSSSSDNSDSIYGKGIRNNESETGRKPRNMTAFKASAKKVLVTPVATVSPKLPIIKTTFNNSRKAGNVKSVSHFKDKNRMQRVNKSKTSVKEKVSEKILHVIETETENNVFESTRNARAISSPSSPKSPSHENSSLSSHEVENEETKNSGKINSEKTESLATSKGPPAVKENHNKTVKKIKVVIPEDNKNRPPVKLKFRNGKIMDVQSYNNSPRRLRFRRARVIGPEEVKGDVRRRIFKKASVNNDVSRAESSSERVVLKHQDVQGKKDAQGLFNNVIEETASKLVESRKSKVKALVGAFETVISLQESKPSVQAAG